MATIPEEDMPAPRMELRWRDTPKTARGFTCECVYSLVIKLDRYDRRAEGEDSDGNHEFGVKKTLSVEIGRTLSDGSADSHYHRGSDSVMPPFRDGAHARWDSLQLGKPPIYCIASGRAEKLEVK